METGRNTGGFRINGERLLERLQQFGSIGATAGGGVNRPALSSLDRQARSLLAELAFKRGFKVFQDDMANMFIRREGSRFNAPPFVIGSHLDSQPMGGKYDGALGVLCAFEVLETLDDLAIATRIPIEVVAWTNEEGSRFAPGAMGSKAYSQGLIPDEWMPMTAADGGVFADELAATLAALPQAERRELGGTIAGYLEVHIEQGPSLEADNIPIGVVIGVQGTRWLKSTFIGEAGHAGTTMRDYRKDPLAAATHAMNVLYETLMPTDEDARFTIGKLDVHPGSVNTIPACVEVFIDIRHPDNVKLGLLEDKVRDVCAQSAQLYKCAAEVEKVVDMAPAEFSQDLVAIVTEAAQELGLDCANKISGAFHDALFIGDIAPSAMIFVPCRQGRSHCEDEHVDPQHAIMGADVLFQASLKAAKPG